MLRIKKEIDLKELEKFGFKLKFNNLRHTSYYVKPISKQEQEKFRKETLASEQSRILENNDVVAVVKEDYNSCLNRKIFLITRERCRDLEYPFSEVNERDIQDLIQAGYVEKVEE